MRAFTLSLLFGLTACTEQAEVAGASGAESATSSPEKLYRSKNCVSCHGHDLRGTMLAPALRGLAAHWNAEELAQFLREPKAWLEKDARLAEVARTYRSPMPPTFGTDAERLALAQWLLAQP